MTTRSWLFFALREFRGARGRLAFFAACLSVGVAAIVAVSGLATALDSGIQIQARQLLAADVELQSRRPVPSQALDAIDAIPGSERADIFELASVVAIPSTDDALGESMLCELKAVSGGYPFYGELVLDPPGALVPLLGADRVVVAPELLDRLDVHVGDTLKLGDATFTIAGTVSKEPDRLGLSFTLGPRVFLSLEGLERSGLTGRGSRVEYRTLVRLPDGTTSPAVRAAAATIRDALPEPGVVSVETYVEAQPSLRRGLARVERFLGLVALLSLFVGGIGVAQAVRAWLAGRIDEIAILRALGTRPREVFLLYLGQTIALGFLGSVVGAALGSGVAGGVPYVLAELLPVAVSVGWQPAAIARGIALGVSVALLFGLGPLTQVLRVPPVRVFRRDAEPLPVAGGVTLLLGIALVSGVAMISSLQSGSLVTGAAFAGGLCVATVLLAAAAWGIVRAVDRVPRGFGSVAFRHGLAALGRPGAGTQGAVVALGLGVLVVLGMYLIEERLAAQLAADMPENAPSVFVIDIQPDQWDGVREVLVDADARDLTSVEVVMARLRSLDGIPVSELVPDRDSGEDAGRRRWVLTREQRLTSMQTLPEGNTIVDGTLWSDPDRAEVSVERDFAADLGVTVGSTLQLDIQGVPIELVVSSIRTVEWERFTINFFLVVEPGVLDDAPRFRVASARMQPEVEQPVQNRLAAMFPNITLLRLREVLDKIITILKQVGFGVRLLGTFTVFAGVAILVGAVSAGTARRLREVALYKTLGMTRAQVATTFAVEYALVGFVAGTIGSLGGVVLAWSVTRFGFEIEWAFKPLAYLLAVSITVVLTVVAGFASSLRALAARPLAVLRETAG